jgi:large subunit ribosomal protein L29
MPRAIVEMRDLPDEELVERLESSKEELFNLRFQLATGQLDNPMRIKQVRHDVARILTVLRERTIDLEADEAVAAPRPAPAVTPAAAPKRKRRPEPEETTSEDVDEADVEAVAAGDETEPEGVEAAQTETTGEGGADQPARRRLLRRKRSEDA